jgi:hypothetical protein
MLYNCRYYKNIKEQFYKTLIEKIYKFWNITFDCQMLMIIIKLFYFVLRENNIHDIYKLYTIWQNQMLYVQIQMQQHDIKFG